MINVQRNCTEELSVELAASYRLRNVGMLRETEDAVRV